MKAIKSVILPIAIGLVLSIILSSMVMAAVTYEYKSNNFTNISGPYTTSQKITGTISLYEILLPNSVYLNAWPMIQTFSFTDGINKLGNQNSIGANGYLETDAKGNIKKWELAFIQYKPNPPQVNGIVRGIQISTGMGNNGVGFIGRCLTVTGDICSSANSDGGAGWTDFYNGGGVWKIHKNTTLPNIPNKPTATPNLSTFPKSDSFFSTISNFIKDEASEFSEETKNFLIEQGLKLDKWMRDGNVKRVADISATNIKRTTFAASTICTLLTAKSLNEAVNKLAVDNLVNAYCANNNCSNATERNRILLKILQKVLSYATSAAAGDPRCTLVWFNAVIWELGVAAELEKIAKDPPDPDYEFLFQPVPLGLPDLPSTGNAALDEEISALYWQQQELYQYIGATNISFDRYATALLAEDAISTALQLQAILYYLGQYDDALQGIANKLDGLPNLLMDAGYQDKPVDRTLLDAVKNELQASGFPADTIELLRELGLSLEDMELVKQSILAIDPNELPSTSWQALNELATSYRNASTLATTAPVALCQNLTVSANSGCKANASVDDGSYDPDGDSIILTQSPPSPYGLGGTSVTLTVTDSNGAFASCSATVTVVDTTPPMITSVTASPNALWPPNHKMVLVKVTVTTSDNCTVAPVCTITSVTSNEPDNGLGDGDTANDIVVTGDLSVNLRAERSGTGNGRVYTVTGECTDAAGNGAPWSTTVTVPHDKGK